MKFKNKIIMIVLVVFLIGMIGSVASADAAHTAGTKKYNVKLTQKEHNTLTKYDIKYKVETKYKTVKKCETVKEYVTKYRMNYKYEYSCNFKDDSYYDTCFKQAWYDKYGYGCNITYGTLNCTEDSYPTERDSYNGIPYRINFNSSKYYKLNIDCPLNDSYYINVYFNISKKIPYDVLVEKQVVKNIKVPYKVKIPYKVRRKVSITKTIPNKYLKIGTPVYKTRKVLETEGKYLFVGKSYTYGYQDKFQRLAMKQTLAKIKKAGYTIHWDNDYYKQDGNILYHFCYCTRKVWKTEKYWVKDVNIKKYPIKMTLNSYGIHNGEWVPLGKGVVYAEVWTSYCPIYDYNVRIK